MVSMGTVAPRNRLIYRALLASLALHLMLLAFIPPFASIAGGQNVELLSFVRIQTVRIQTPKPKPQPPAKAAVQGAVRSSRTRTHRRSRCAPFQHAAASAAQRQVAPVLGSAQPGASSR